MSDTEGPGEPPGPDEGPGPLYRNPISFAGALLMIGGGVLIVLSLLLQLLLTTSPYLGIVIYLVFPGIVFLGLLVFLFGMRRESGRRRRGEAAALAYPRIDLNQRSQRRRFGFVLVGGTILAIVLAFTAYNAFLWTESVEFCGKLCHTVMEPEYTTYQISPHARVACVECHVGGGASWYVRSKLSGVRQVFATILDTYPRPIPTPVANLRPARETCLECHWPDKFFGAQLLQIPYFRFDRDNTAEQLTMLVKTGGGGGRFAAAQQQGIHWHMAVANDVWYAARTADRQEIPWVHVRHRDGSEATYLAPGAPPLDVLQPVRLFDCIDCHNRPTHIFVAPDAALDRALAAGTMPRDLPWIKTVAFEALTRIYPSRERAHEAIREAITGRYREHPPAGGAGDAVARAVAAALEIYDHNVFPRMNASWRTYPDHIGHMNWPGCARCHDGRHATAGGRVLTRECDACHTRPERGPLQPLGVATRETGDWHLFPLEGEHAEALCTRCHAVGKRPSSDCATCHGIDTRAPMMDSMSCDDCHREQGRVRPLVPCKSCHEDLGGIHDVEAHSEAPCTACHPAHTWRPAGRALCLQCHTDRQDHPPGGGACADCHG